jgi:hypothetical protein
VWKRRRQVLQLIRRARAHTYVSHTRGLPVPRRRSYSRRHLVQHPCNNLSHPSLLKRTSTSPPIMSSVTDSRPNLTTAPMLWLRVFSHRGASARGARRREALSVKEGAHELGSSRSPRCQGRRCWGRCLHLMAGPNPHARRRGTELPKPK